MEGFLGLGLKTKAEDSTRLRRQNRSDRFGSRCVEELRSEDTRRDREACVGGKQVRGGCGPSRRIFAINSEFAPEGYVSLRGSLVFRLHHLDSIDRTPWGLVAAISFVFELFALWFFFSLVFLRLASASSADHQEGRKLGGLLASL